LSIWRGHVDTSARDSEIEGMRIGFFYKSLDDYKGGKHFKAGLVNELDEYIGELPARMPSELCADEKGDTHTDAQLRELMPYVALSTATI
jgi:hypothetical protein